MKDTKILEKIVDKKYKINEMKNKKAILLMKENMTIMEMLEIANELKEFVEDLVVKIANMCGRCEVCESCKELDDSLQIEIPNYLREEAGIAQNAKLWAYTEENSGEIVIEESENKYDITDAPEWIKEAFKMSDVCLSDFNELICNNEKIKIKI